MRTVGPARTYLDRLDSQLVPMAPLPALNNHPIPPLQPDTGTINQNLKSPISPNINSSPIMLNMNTSPITTNINSSPVSPNFNSLLATSPPGAPPSVTSPESPTSLTGGAPENHVHWAEPQRGREAISFHSIESEDSSITSSEAPSEKETRSVDVEKVKVN